LSVLPIAAGTLDFEGDSEFPDLTSAVHYLGHQNAMKTALTVNENLLFWQQFGGEPHLPVQDALETIGLGDIGHLPFAYLSTGQKRRTAIAKLLVTYRPLWVLDEPTAGLDKTSEAQFTALMRALRGWRDDSRPHHHRWDWREEDAGDDHEGVFA
jgi:heme exporter protein A